MQITATSNASPLPAAAQATPAPDPVPAAKAAPDIVSLRRMASLLSALQNNPAIRPEVVARGRALASDPSYPPPDVINKLAALIVNTEAEAAS